jgi:hypothetical protein
VVCKCGGLLCIIAEGIGVNWHKWMHPKMGITTIIFTTYRFVNVAMNIWISILSIANLMLSLNVIHLMTITEMITTIGILQSEIFHGFVIVLCIETWNQRFIRLFFNNMNLYKVLIGKCSIISIMINFQLPC